MKRRQLQAGIFMLVVGGVAFSQQFRFDFPLSRFLFGIAFSGILIGLYNIVHYLYWTSPKRRGKAKDREEWDQIEKEDERNRMISLRAADLAYRIALIVLAVVFVVIVFLAAKYPELEPTTYILSIVWIIVWLLRPLAEILLRRKENRIVN